jgi:hypothetical protein
VIPGLADDQEYFVDVVAVYALGQGTSTPRVSGTTKPGVPTVTSVIGVSDNNTALDVTFAPAVTNRVPVTYQVSAFASQNVTVTPPVAGCTVAATTSFTPKACQITGLAANTRYWVSVVATNPAGDSAASNPRVAGITAFAPSAPQNVLVSRSGAGQLRASWTAPTSAGGTGPVAISGYNATVYWRVGGSLIPVATCTTTGTGSSARSCLFTGLASTSSYVVGVTARNTSGLVGPESALSAAISPNLRLGVVQAGLLSTAKSTAIGFTPRVRSAASTPWTVRVYASATSTRVLGSCRSTTKAGACTVGTLLRGRTYYLTVVRTGATWPVIKLAPRVKVRVR